MIHQMEPWIGPEEATAVSEYLSSGGWLTEFKKTEQFAKMLSDYVGSKHAIIVSNGTVSLYIALLALGIGPGDEVIVPDYTMIATPNSVRMAGAIPIFVDIDLSNLCLDLDLMEKVISKRTKAVMVVSLNGRSPDMERVVSFTRSKNIHLIEDAAQSLGSRFKGRHLGSFGAIGSFSFSTPKVITTGQGGALITDDDQLADKIRKIKDFGRLKGGEDVHETMGFNFKFTDLQAVIGIEQMKKLEWRVSRKKEIYRLYQSELTNLKEVSFIPTDLNSTSPWFIDMLVPDPSELSKYLRKEGIGSRPMYPAIHSQRIYQSTGHFPNSNYIGEHGLWLPSASSLENSTIKHICKVVREFYN